MLTKIACSLLGTICATVCGLGVSLYAVPALAQTTTNGTTNVTTSPGPNGTRQWWSRPDYSDAELATIPDRLVPIPAAARRARAEFNGTNFVKVNGKIEQMAPGVRIFGADNMLKVSGALNGFTRIKYLREQTTGLLLQVWILTPKEIETRDPEPVDASTK
jgi:hypothetical protein